MTGKITFARSGKFERSENTRAEFDRDVTDREVQAVLEKLAHAGSLRTGWVCYVLGMGAQPKSVYISLQSLKGVRVLFSRSLFPWYARWMSVIIGSYQGLVKIDDHTLLPRVFSRLIERSMAGAYIFPAHLEPHFLQHFSSKVDSFQFDLGVKKYPGYSFYIVDADSSESKTGMIEIVSYGISTPQDILPIATEELPGSN